MSPPRRPPLLREFIEIPDASAISDSDFVFRLAEGIGDAEAALRDYVVTPGLVDNFDQALGLISTALARGASMAAYLHGSFGSGKSHFMAVLSALLRGDGAARDRQEFAPLLAKHDGWLEGRRFLLVPCHMLGAKSVEQPVLGGYLEHVRRASPGVQMPQVHRTDAQLSQARKLREKLGDQAFLALLPAAGQDDDTWACHDWAPARHGWTPARLDRAFTAPPDDADRRRLVNDLLRTWQHDFFRNALEDAEGFISLDRGLTEIAGHAKGLGYDALVLFLDELILWIATWSTDREFVGREIQKLTNFVEGGEARRPIPVITFVARQRDLRELLGPEFTGASELAFQDTLSRVSGRFDVIRLDDRDLPEVVRRRLLKRKGGDGGPADEAITRAFEGITRVRPEVWDTLLGSGAGTGSDLESFGKTYPFSPAFLATLVYVSSALQRSRTALKLMRQLLVDRRDELRLGQLVPLGDLYDVISRGGDQPSTERLTNEFAIAQRLYLHKFRPYLLDRYGLTDGELELARRGADLDPERAARVRSFTGDDRLIKTLLLAALAPSVPALRELTARKLAALNHGSISSPIPGGEVGQISRKLAEWAGRFGELRLASGDNVTAHLELVGVDIDGTLDAARHFDTRGARRRLVRQLLCGELGITDTARGFDQLHLVWRGSHRTIEVAFGNLGDEESLRDDAFLPSEPSTWRMIIGYPWSDAGRAPFGGRNRVERLKGRVHARTVCWLPADLTPARLRDLGRLVILDAVLRDQRFDTFVSHLGADDRLRVHSALTNQRDSLSLTMRSVLRQAYGLAAKQPEDVLTSYGDHLLGFPPGQTFSLPTGATLGGAVRDVADQMLRHQYPAHPDFDPMGHRQALRSPELRTVLEYVRRAVETPGGVIQVNRKDRTVMRRVAGPLLLGEVHDATFVLGRHWVEHFERLAAWDGIDDGIRVPDLRRWLDHPEPRGLDPLVAQLIFACFAEQTDRTWIRHGGVVTPQPELTAITNDLALRNPELPSQRDWAEAGERGMKLFGFLPPAPRRGRLVALFVRDLSRQAQRYRGDAHRLVGELERHLDQLGLDPRAKAGRLHTARVAADLLDGLVSSLNNVEIVRHLARADLGGPAERIGTSIRSSADVAQALRGAAWDTFSIAEELDDQWAGEATAILAMLRQAAADDELATPLIPALNKARARATDLVRRATKPARRPDTGPGDGWSPHQDRPESARQIGPDPAEESGNTVTTFEEVESALAWVREAARRNPGRQIRIEWRVL